MAGLISATWIQGFDVCADACGNGDDSPLAQRPNEPWNEHTLNKESDPFLEPPRHLRRRVRHVCRRRYAEALGSNPSLSSTLNLFDSSTTQCTSLRRKGRVNGANRFERRVRPLFGGADKPGRAFMSSHC